jgi:ABC-type polysaccharide/polyol phosphate export permease
MIGLFATGIGFFTSILQTRIRDVAHIVNLITRIGFFLSPVFFTLKTMSRVPEQYLEIYLFVNPMAVYLEMVRSSITGLPLGIGLPHIVSAFIVPLIVFYLGSIFFMRKERKAVKYL